jgi:hypothetical protein
MSESKNLAITSVTISLEVADKNFGNGSSRFCTLTASAKSPDVGIPLDNIDDVILQTLDMHLACYKSIAAQRFADGVIKAEEVNKALEKMPQRLLKIRDFLSQM